MPTFDYQLETLRKHIEELKRFSREPLTFAEMMEERKARQAKLVVVKVEFEDKPCR